MKLATVAQKYVAQIHPDRHGDKLTTHSYVPVYGRLFSDYRNRGRVRMLEIGVAAGLSIQMWQEWFGDTAIVTGVDCSAAWLSPALREQFEIIIGHSNVPSCRRAVEAGGRRFDIIIDDGDHDPSIQLGTFHNFWPLVEPGGIYVVEDVANVDAWGHEFALLHDSCEIYDLRSQKGRGDDVMIVYRKPLIDPGQ